MNPDFMRRAIALSKRGTPMPNPHVGCVIVRNGTIVGEGWHERAGQPHAEARALSVAGDRAKGADVYVTLEPCAHHGRTPPCSDALLAAGVARVFVAVTDPNPIAAGGIERLRAAGVEVEEGILAEAAEAANRRWLGSVRMGRPWVVAKAAISLDGRIARPDGESRWISGEAARKAGRRLRGELGSVLVGRGTVQADDPQLTVRSRASLEPALRVVLDPEGRLDPSARVFRGDVPTLWAVRQPQMPLQTAVAWRPDGFDLEDLLSQIAGRGIRGLLVEGGGTTIARFLKAHLVDELHLFVAGLALGAGPAWIEGELAQNLAESPRFQLDAVRRVGDDLSLRYLRSG